VQHIQAGADIDSQPGSESPPVARERRTGSIVGIDIVLRSVWRPADGLIALVFRAIDSPGDAEGEFAGRRGPHNR
jgi:hypothetical protein